MGTPIISKFRLTQPVTNQCPQGGKHELVPKGYYDWRCKKCRRIL